MADLLFWPAILGYGEAAFAYASPRHARLGTWGVRVGWLAQTALLGVQAAQVGGFPWSSWAGSLNLFVWLVVSTYLIWGCQPRYQLVGLAIMPLAALLFAVARVGGGTAGDAPPRYGNLFLAVHVGFVLAAFAGFTVAAALAALYLVEERRLRRHAPDILRLRLPSLVSLETLTRRTITVAWPLLTIGLLVGLVRLRDEHGRLDAMMSATLATWLLYAAFVAARPSGQRAAQLALVGFTFVIVTRIALAGSHF
jgi:ABC-type transport system involved in cytochrome c biogenesis permease subunit